jgi:hypothetical protein
MTRLFLPALLMLSACGGDSSVQDMPVCTADFRPGIVVTVLDDATGAAASCGARAVVTAPGYSVTVENPAMPGCPDSLALSAAHERPGTYTVTVSKPGYRDFTQSNIVVGADVCHVITAQVTARLVPL